MEDSEGILSKARKLRRTIADTSSADLPPVHEPFSGQQINSWRRNGHYKGDAIHSMMSRVGGFPASLARYLIAAYSKPGELVVDPFCGKGTTLYEAAIMNRVCIGGDVAPDAVIVSRAKCSNVRLEEVIHYIEKMKIDCRSPRYIPRDIRTFYHPETLKQIIAVRKRVGRDMENDGKSELATFVCALMLGILHGHSRNSLSLPCNQCFAMSPAYVRKYVEKHGLERPLRDVKRCLLARVLEYYPRSKVVGTTEVHEASVVDCPKYLRKNKGHVALILTSPPYLNRQTYVKDSWLRHWFLDRDINSIAKTSVESGSIKVFVPFLQKAIAASVEVVRKGGRIAIVCGEAKVSVGGRQQVVNISELAMVAIANLNLPRGELEIESLIRDRKKMVRGSYFAVHGGKSVGRDGQSHDRYGAEEILILRKRR